MLWQLYIYRGHDHQLVLTHPMVPYVMYVLYNTYEINLCSAPLLYMGVIIILEPGHDVSEKSTVEFAQVTSSDSASEDYIIHITDRTMPRLPLNS